MSLRDYQQHAIEAVEKALEAERHSMLQARSNAAPPAAMNSFFLNSCRANVLSSQDFNDAVAGPQAPMTLSETYGLSFINRNRAFRFA